MRVLSGALLNGLLAVLLLCCEVVDFSMGASRSLNPSNLDTVIATVQHPYPTALEDPYFAWSSNGPKPGYQSCTRIYLDPDSYKGHNYFCSKYDWDFEWRTSGPPPSPPRKHCVRVSHSADPKEKQGDNYLCYKWSAGFRLTWSDHGAVIPTRGLSGCASWSSLYGSDQDFMCWEFFTPDL
jgi:hypothetical protein